jgi:uncharacterized heparinase superfamily protein
MSSGRHRLIVNCGSAPLRGEEWLGLSRTTAAHSTVCVADRSSARFVKQRWAARVLGPRVADGPGKVRIERHESDLGALLTAAHDGYVPRFALVHERRLYLSVDGDDCRGEDRLLPPTRSSPRSRRPRRQPDGAAVPFAVRFHLHPDVRASLSRDGTRVLLMLPNGEGWQFRANRPDLSVEESIYCGGGEDVRRSRQIVLSGVADPAQGASVKWAFHRLTRKRDERASSGTGA